MFRSGTAMPRPVSEQLLQCTPRSRPARPGGHPAPDPSRRLAGPFVRLSCPSPVPLPFLALPRFPFTLFAVRPASAPSCIPPPCRRPRPAPPARRRTSYIAPLRMLSRAPPRHHEHRDATNTGEHKRTQTPTFQRKMSVFIAQLSHDSMRHAEGVQMPNGKMRTDRGNMGLTDKSAEATNRFVGTERTQKAASNLVDPADRAHGSMMTKGA